MEILKLHRFHYLILGAIFLLAIQGCKDNDLPDPAEEPEEAELSEVTDIDGNVYPVIRIGDQYWMQENLKVTHLTDGTPIDHVPKNFDWANQEAPAYSWYGNNPDHKDIYGALYNRSAAHSGKLCPTGWQVPTKKDFQELTDYALSMGGYVGNSLREEGYDHWESAYPYVVYADNKTGFSARGGGMRDENGEYADLKKHGYWWHSEGHMDYATWAKRLTYNRNDFLFLGSPEDYGFSVRCVKSE